MSNTQNEETCTHDCSSCSANCSSRQPESLIEPANEMSEIKHVIGIVSGKGGVGKSLVSTMLSVLMRRRGYNTAVLDADITGPSVPKALGVSGEDKFIGEGISFCAVCDGAFYKDKTVAVVGGGNSALEEAILLSKTCKKVYIIHMLNNFQGNQKNIERVKTIENIEIKMTSEIKNIIGEDKLEKVLVLNSETKLEETLDLDGIFIAIGRVPNTEKLKMLETDKYGYILTDENMKTNINGVYVAGDIRQKNVRQIVTACSDGAIAATSVATYIN